MSEGRNQMQGEEAMRRLDAGTRDVGADDGSSELSKSGGLLKPEALFPKLVPRRNASARAVSAHQRARLHAAVIEACVRHGYADTTARELAALAGVSTRSLYKHFGSKEECFLATYDLIVQQAMGRISAAYRGDSRGADRDWSDGLCRAFDAFAEELIQRPDPSRLVLVEVLAVAPVAMARIERAESLFTTMIATSLAEAPDGVVPPPKIIRPLIGGVWFVARSRLLGADPEAITAAGAELREWLLAYRSPATTALPVVRPRRASVAHGTRRVAPVQSERDRMLQVAAAVVARGGYAALSPGEVVELAGVGEGDFADQFGDIRGCFLAMLDWLSARAIAEAVRESRDAPTWSSSVVRAIESLFHRLAADAALARAVSLDAFAAGPAGGERLETIMRGLAELLRRRAPEQGRPSALVAEAIVGSVWSIVHRHIVLGRRELLPGAATRAAFLTLAPIIGADAALAAIVAEH
jgi:AcrR family transcriptional regulator